MQLETPRLLLREYVPEDFDALHEILSDPETMQHYPHPFSPDETRQWIERNRARYAEYGFGLWAVILKSDGRLIGDCGITMQPIHGRMLPEVGYHIHRSHQRRGYASEAAAECIRYAFEELSFETIYSYMKYSNIASCRTAEKNGLRFVEEYDDPVNTRTRVYALSRSEWESRR